MKNKYYRRFTDGNEAAQHDPALSLQLSVVVALMDHSFMPVEWLDRLANAVERQIQNMGTDTATPDEP